MIKENSKVQDNLPKILLCKDLKDENGEPFSFMDNKHYFIDVLDDSMKDDMMNKGDNLIVEYTESAKSGDIVVYKDKDGKIIIRVLYLDKEKNKFYLKASNDEKDIYHTIYLDGDVEILGVVKQVMKDLV